MTQAQQKTPTAPMVSIADPFWDLLAQLDYGRRQGLVRRLAVGYYEDWRPSRDEVALLVDFELGRITEAEYLAAAPRPVVVPAPEPPAEPPTPIGRNAAELSRSSRPRAASSGRSGNGRAPGKPTRIATFNVDCGEMAPPFRLIVRGLTTNGWTIRGSQRYRLMTLHYVLLPPIGVARKGQSTTPVLYTAAITCVPDVMTPWADSDGRHRQHSVGSGHIAGSRGPWPVADNVRAIDFLFNRQQPVGSALAAQSAGVLRVDVARSTATWRPASRPAAATVYG